MRAAVLSGTDQPLALRDLRLGSVLEHEVRIRTAACGICHSDLHVIEGNLGQSLPAVLGHEASGVVLEVGKAVSSLRAGDHVVACLSAFCGACEACRTGRSYLCARRGELRRTTDQPQRLDDDGNPVAQMAGLGGFAEEMLVHERALVKVPNEIPLDRAALLGCAVLTGVGSVFNGARLQPGSRVVVIGAGGVGCNVIQGAKLAGAKQVIAVDVHQEKLELAKTFGATDVVDAAAGDAVAAVRELTSGGAEHVFEAIGLASTIRQAIEMTSPGGATYMVGVPPAAGTIPIPAADMVLSGRSLHGLLMGSNHFPRDIPLLADMYLQGRLLVDELIGERIELEEINNGIDRLRSGTFARSVVVFA